MNLMGQRRHEALAESRVITKRSEKRALWIDMHAGSRRRHGVAVIPIREQGRLGKQLTRSRRMERDRAVVDGVADQAHPPVVHLEDRVGPIALAKQHLTGLERADRRETTELIGEPAEVGH